MQKFPKSDMRNRISKAFFVAKIYVDFTVALYGEASSGQGLLIPFLARIITIRMTSRSPDSGGNLSSYHRFCVFAKFGHFPFVTDHDGQESVGLTIGTINHTHYVTHV